MLTSGCDVRECRVLLLEEVRIGERATCPSLGSPDGVSLDSEARHVSSGERVPTMLPSTFEKAPMLDEPEGSMSQFDGFHCGYKEYNPVYSVT